MDTTNYLASMEAAYRSTEVQLFGDITNTSYARASVSGYPDDLTYTNPNDSVARVDSNSAGGQKIGPNLLLKVMSGDTVKLGVQCYYNSGSGSTNNSSFSDVLNSLANGLVNTTGGAHGTLTNLTSSSSTVYTGLTSFLGGFDSAHTGYPKAYINWIFLDDQFNYVSSLSGSVQAASSTYPAGTLNTVAPGSQLALNRNGYLYIWVSNETQGWDVFFDNLAVQYKQGPVLEENHYYPFGLTMAGISDKAIKVNYSENKYRFNEGSELQNKEFRDGTGLEMYDAGFKRLDPQLGRFAQIDPMADEAHFFSTYAYAANSPIAFNDPTGLLAMNPQWMATYDLLMNRNSGGGGGGGESDVDQSMDVSEEENDFATNLNNNIANTGSVAAGSEVSFDEQVTQTMSQITPNALQLFPLAAFLGSDFASVNQSTNRWGNPVLRLQFNNSVIQNGDAAAGSDVNNYSVVNLYSFDLSGIQGLLGGIRAPDYLNFNLSVALPNPITGTAVGWNMAINFDRHGTLYWSPLGISVGKSQDALSFSFTANWILQNRSATEDEDYSFLSGHGINVGGGFFLGGGISWSPGNGFALGAGVYSPQVGISYNYTPAWGIAKGDGITW